MVTLRCTYRDDLRFLSHENVWWMKNPKIFFTQSLFHLALAVNGKGRYN